MFCERTVTQRVRLPPRYLDAVDQRREVERALPYLLRHTVLQDGSVVQAVLSWQMRRFAEYEPHGTALVNLGVDVRALVCTAEATMVVRVHNVRPGAGDALLGEALGATVRVPGFGPACRHGTAVAGAPWARVRLIAPDAAADWVALASGPYLGLPCCVADDGAEDEDSDMDE